MVLLFICQSFKSIYFVFVPSGGFHMGETIKSNLIDHYIPFLPLEEHHVKQCIRAEFRRRGKEFPREEHIK
jgi:hypothetical protein